MSIDSLFLGVTANYFVIVEQPLTVSLCALVRNQLQDKPLASSLKWFADQEVKDL